MTHPLDFLPLNLRKPLFFTLLALTVILFAVLGIVDKPLQTPAAPCGIVSFELAASPRVSKVMIDLRLFCPKAREALPLLESPESSKRMVDSWDADARLSAAFSLGLDYLFMPIYAFALAFGALLAMGKFSGWIKSLGAVAGWGAFGAALFDMVENYALWRVLLGDVDSSFPEVAAFCASIKFILFFLALFYGLAGLAVTVINLIKRAASNA